MKICMIADVHVGVPGRLNDIMWALRRTRQYCAEHDIKHIVVLGDMLHDREQIRVEDLNVLVDFLIETDEKFGITIITFPGNHDMYLKNSWEINSLKPLTRYCKSYHDISRLELGGVRFWIVPFIHYESNYIKVIDAISRKHRDGDVLLTHIGVRSSTLNMCFLLKSWSVVDFSDCPFDRIYAGHFHIHQQVGSNLWYPGSLIPFKFDEGDTDHGFIVFDTTTRTHEFVNLWEQDDADRPPQFLTLDDSSLNSLDADTINGNIIRVALSKEYTHNQLADIRRTVQAMGAKDVRWMNLASKEEKDNIVAAQGTASSVSDLFERFAKADRDGIKNLNFKLLLKFNTEIMADGDRKYLEQGEAL